MSSSDKEEPLPISFADVQESMGRIRQHVAYTPVMECSYFNSQSRFQLYFKCENFQSTGAFKVILSSYCHHYFLLISSVIFREIYGALHNVSGLLNCVCMASNPGHPHRYFHSCGKNSMAAKNLCRRPGFEASVYTA